MGTLKGVKSGAEVTLRHTQSLPSDLNKAGKVPDNHAGVGTLTGIPVRASSQLLATPARNSAYEEFSSDDSFDDMDISHFDTNVSPSDSEAPQATVEQKPVLKGILKKPSEKRDSGEAAAAKRPARFHRPSRNEAPDTVHVQTKFFDKESAIAEVYDPVTVI